MKEISKVLSIFLISVFLITVMIGIVAAQNPFDPIKDMFTSWGEGNLSVNVAKYLFLALLTILIFSIAKVIPMIKKLNVWLIALFSLIVAFLATAYVTPEEIYMMLISYGAMGMILGAIIPLMVLVFFSYEMGKSGEGGTIIQYVLWIGFAFFLAYKVYSGIVITDTIGWVEAGLYVVLIILSLIFIFANRQIMRMVFKSGIKDVKEKVYQEIEEEDVVRKADKKRFEKMKKRALRNP